MTHDEDDGIEMQRLSMEEYVEDQRQSLAKFEKSETGMDSAAGEAFWSSHVNVKKCWNFLMGSFHAWGEWDRGIAVVMGSQVFFLSFVLEPCIS